MKTFLVALLSLVSAFAYSQQQFTITKEMFMKDFSSNACDCIGAIDVTNKTKAAIAIEVSQCLEAQTVSHIISDQLLNALSTGKNVSSIILNVSHDKNSQLYKDHYYQLERYVMDNCSALASKMGANNEEHENSFSKNNAALEAYYKGMDASDKENYTEAIAKYEEAVKIDPKFAFAWDNLGMVYRKVENYDKAVYCYQKSLEADPKGLMPMENIAYAYELKKDFAKAIESFEKLAKFDPSNPEIYYGIGRIYAYDMPDYERALTNMCKAYTLYVQQKSPYRTDAEKNINYLKTQMKNAGKEARFKQILKENNVPEN